MQIWTETIEPTDLGDLNKLGYSYVFQKINPYRNRPSPEEA